MRAFFSFMEGKIDGRYFPGHRGALCLLDGGRYHPLRVAEKSAALRRAPPRSAALRRARHLRDKVLSRRESREIERLGYFFLASPTRAATVYRIPLRADGKVRTYVRGGPQHDLCIGFADMPEDDVVVARKLWILGNEDAFRAAANSFVSDPDAGDLEYQRWQWWAALRSRRAGGVAALRHLLTSIPTHFSS